MYLLQQDDDGILSLVLYYKNPPPYAILSHRWVDDEPTFQDIKNGLGKNKLGYDKLLFCGRQAAKDGLNYFWVDTVCIDKTSSAELTEALNSMFRWYQQADKCYVYMSDVVSVEQDFEKSAWFTRGWTLQELIAPKVVDFHSQDGTCIGTKDTMEAQINSVTKIPLEALRGQSLNSFSIEERISWVANRTTTREEDMSYCLLGILDVYMPVLYGEGDRALGRLLREVEASSKGPRDLKSLKSITSLQRNSREITQPVPSHELAPSTSELDHYNRCKRALYHADLLLRHHEIKCFASSQWLFDHETFREWNSSDIIKSSSGLLTLEGNPGTGKSVLMKEAARRAEDSDCLMLHHYFDRSKDTSSHFKSALDKFCTSLLYQLLSKLEPKPWSFLDQWGDLLLFKPGMMPWNLTQLQDAIHEIVVGHEKRGNVKVRIFIDAINECYHDENDPRPAQPLELLQWVDKLLKSADDAGANVRVCLSRPHLPTYGGLEPKSQTIVVEDHNLPGIEAFVADALKDNKIDANLRYLLHHKIIQRCTNDFLWATVVVQDILANLEVLNDKGLLKLIDRLPGSQKEIYERTLRAADGLQGAYTLRLLQTVWAAQRPMTADELRHSLAFAKPFEFNSIAEWEQSINGLEKGAKFENYLRKESRGLIEIHQSSKMESHVRFIHGSVSVFLGDPSSVLPAEALPWLERCHFTLLQTCFHELDARPTDPVAFNDYAAEYWIHHARECGNLLDEMSQFPTFLEDCSKRKAKRIIERQVMAVKQSHARQRHLLEDNEGLLVILATLGCTKFLQRHLAGCEACQRDVGMYSLRYRKALQNSIIGRWTEITIWLLEKHIDANFDINELYEDKTLLYKACYFGQKEVVSFLLARGADPCKPSPIGYEYPIHAAIQLGREDVIRILLEHSSAHDQFKLCRSGGYTPLHNAVESRQPTKTKIGVLKLLLKMAPRGVGLLTLKNDEGTSVLDVARREVNGAGVEHEEILDEIEDFHDEEQSCHT